MKFKNHRIIQHFVTIVNLFITSVLATSSGSDVAHKLIFKNEQASRSSGVLINSDSAAGVSLFRASIDLLKDPAECFPACLFTTNNTCTGNFWRWCGAYLLAENFKTILMHSHVDPQLRE